MGSRAAQGCKRSPGKGGRLAEHPPPKPADLVSESVGPIRRLSGSIRWLTAPFPREKLDSSYDLSKSIADQTHLFHWNSVSAPSFYGRSSDGRGVGAAWSR